MLTTEGEKQNEISQWVQNKKKNNLYMDRRKIFSSLATKQFRAGKNKK